MDGFGHAPELHHGDDKSAHDHLLPLASIAHPARPSKNDGLTPVDVSHHSPSFGFLDMGGASTQLAFSPTRDEIERSRFPQEDLARVSLRLLSGEIVEWPVFAASWLGFGTNRVRERYVERLAKGVSASDTQVSDACLPVGLRVPTPDATKHPDFVGAGNFSDCLTALKPLLKHDAPCPAQHCLFGGLATPHIDFHRQDQRGFIGISEYWYTANQVLGLGGVWDWAEWERSMGDFCAQDWKDIEAKVKASDPGAEVELSRLQMQCFKGAWISNILHDGIGIPRLVDAGGNDTLTGGELGGTNAEAERRAKEKGLFNKQGKKAHSHFQSMDEVDNTAISWTLGKIVIEASKAVRVEGSGSRLIDGISFGPRVSELTAAMWAYLLVACAIVALLFSALRRRRLRRRKSRPSFLGIGLGLPCQDDGYAYEEAGAKRPAGSFRLWSQRVANTLRRTVSSGGTSRPGNRRHASMPLSASQSNLHSQSRGTSSASSSQPPSPRAAGFGTPGYPRTFSMDTPPAATPPRGGARNPRPSPRKGASTPYLGGTNSGGWNDPPSSMLGSGAVSAVSTPLDEEDLSASAPAAMLTPSASSVAEHTLSRQSSRVNLSELGLAQRSTTRTNTPHIG
jgi:hypothetical protein